ncbi:MAG: type II pantothenate kinase [Eubacteriales bacterium]
MNTVKITVGIDIGGSTTKIIGIRGDEIITPMIVKANDPIASLFGAFGKFIDQNALSLGSIERIAITGVGSSHVDKSIYDIETIKVQEFLCNGYGGLHLSGLKSATIVSMGTGTAIVRACNGDIEHVGGTGVGGGTLLGLSNRMLNIREIDLLIETAKDGDLSNVDLLVSDISRDVLPTLPSKSTASNFGKISDLASKSDIAMGIINLVFETIGTLAAFAARSSSTNKIVLIGNLTTIPQCHDVMRALEAIYPNEFIIPDHAEFGTAVGAALSLIKK